MVDTHKASHSLRGRGNVPPRTPALPVCRRDSESSPPPLHCGCLQHWSIGTVCPMPPPTGQTLVQLAMALPDTSVMGIIHRVVLKASLLICLQIILDLAVASNSPLCFTKVGGRWHQEDLDYQRCHNPESSNRGTVSHLLMSPAQGCLLLLAETHTTDPRGTGVHL